MIQCTTMKKEIDLFIFDLDGTLLDSKDGIVDAVLKTAEDFGCPLQSREAIVSYIGTGIEDLMHLSTGITDPARLEQSIIHLKKVYNKIGDRRASLYPKVLDVLDFFRDKKMVILTNRQYDIAKCSVDFFNIGAYFLEIVGGDDLSCKKPSGCPIVKLLERHAVRKDRALMVGDMVIDVEAGKDAGVHTCAITWGLGNHADIHAAEPDFIIDDIEELKEIVV